MFVSMLRHKGIPARSRIGFAVYFASGFNHDHVVAEYWNGDRWVMIDPQLDPAGDHPFDSLDLPKGPFLSAAEVWLGVRAGDLDADLFGVDPGLPIRGGWFIRNYVHLQLAHLNGDDAEHTDEIATLLVASDNGDEAATKELTNRYESDPSLHFTRRVLVTSPTGAPFTWLDLQNPNSHGA